MSREECPDCTLGLALFNDRFEVQRCDACATLESDDDAADLVNAILTHHRAWRDRVAREANAQAASSNARGAPTLSRASSRESVCAWLQWCDPNGSHIDALARREGGDPYSTVDAWEALATMVGGGR